MVRVLIVVVAVAAGAFAVLRSVETAFACSGPGPVENMLQSTVIFEGRITAVVPTGEPSEGARLPHTMTIEVVHAHLGTTDGATVTARAYIPDRTQPIMCPQFPQPAELVGKYVVIGLDPDPNVAGALRADAWVTPFMGDALAGEGYREAAGLARMMSDSDPAAPTLTVSSPATCGQPVRYTGRNFAPGQYLLRAGAFSGRVTAVFDVGTAGTFDITEKFVWEGCTNKYSEGRVIGAHVYSLASGIPWVYQNWESLIDIGKATVTGVVDDPNGGMLLRVVPGEARCGETVTFRGEGFEPGEALEVRVAAVTVGTVSASPNGTFFLDAAIPVAACTQRYVDASVHQALFAQYNPPFFGLTGAGISLVGPLAEPGSTLTPPPATQTPAPPIVGTGAATAAVPTTAHDLVILGAALLLATGLFLAASVRVLRR